MRSSDADESLAALAAAVGALDAVELVGLSDAALGAQLRGVWVQVCRLHAQLSRRIAMLDERGAAGRDGARSIRHWLRHRLRVDGVAAATLATAASALAARPAVALAYRQGEISMEHVAALDEAGWLLGAEAMDRSAERVLLDRARREPPGRVRRVARRLRERLDPAGSLLAFRRLREERWLDLTRTPAGAVVIRGQLDPGDGEVLLAALGAQRLAPGDVPARTPAQRQADALVSLCRTALRADVFFASDRPRITVTVPLAALTGGLAAESATFGSGEPVPAETARRLACDARVLPAVLGGAGEPLDVGAETLTVPQGLRRALELRDGACRFPGCDLVGSECLAHHLRHWADGGSSTLDNLTLLCPHHHGLVHEGGWRVSRDARTGELRAYRPDGTRLDAR